MAAGMTDSIRDEFYSRLVPIVFDVCTGSLKERKLTSQSLSIAVEF